MAMAFRWLLSGLLGFFIGFGFQWIRSCQLFDNQASTHVLRAEPRLQENTLPEVDQAKPSRLQYEGLQLYSQPASPDDFWKSLRNISAAPETQLQHYRSFVGPYSAYADMSGLEFSLLYLSGLKETDSLLDIGCGALRLGRVVLPYLLPGKYHYIEPNSWLVREALSTTIFKHHWQTRLSTI